MSEFEHQPAAEGAADSEVPRGLAERRRAIKAALIAGPVIATLSSRRALAVSVEGCSVTNTCGPGSDPGATAEPIIELKESGTEEQTTAETGGAPALQQRSDGDVQKVMEAANPWNAPQLK